VQFRISINLKSLLLPELQLDPPLPNCVHKPLS